MTQDVCAWAQGACRVIQVCVIGSLLEKNGLKRILQCRWYLCQDVSLAVRKHHDMTKSKFKNEEWFWLPVPEEEPIMVRKAVTTGSWTDRSSPGPQTCLLLKDSKECPSISVSHAKESKGCMLGIALLINHSRLLFFVAFCVYWHILKRGAHK